MCIRDRGRRGRRRGGGGRGAAGEQEQERKERGKGSFHRGVLLIDKKSPRPGPAGPDLGAADLLFAGRPGGVVHGHGFDVEIGRAHV